MMKYPQGNEKKRRLYTGSYNAPVLTGDGSVYQGNGTGIVVYSFDEEKGFLEEEKRYPEAENASWLAFSPDKKVLYAVNELDDYAGTGGGAISAYSLDSSGELQLLNQLPVMGAAPCHVNCSGDGSAVFTANYNGGNASCFCTEKNGRLNKLFIQITHSFGEEEVPGRNAIRQEKPHVHSASVNGDYLWITDLGMDEISVYRLDCLNAHADDRDTPADDKCVPCCVLSLPTGSGPRSLAFAGNMVYATCELSNEIAVIRWEKEKAELLQMESSLPEHTTVENTVAGILLSPDGRFLYVGNRGHNSIGVFGVDKDGRISPIQWISSGGDNPRGIQISPSGKWLLAANQNSDNVVIFRRDASEGTLEKAGTYKAGAVVCLEFW